MGTRSRIGYELPDHSVVSVYCHWDGHLEYNGRVLAEHYQDREAVQELIDGGSMSSLRTTQLWNSSLVRTEDGDIARDEDDNWLYSPTRAPQPLYHTERGEELRIEHTSFDEFVSGDLGGEEYAYLYDLNGNWKAYHIGWGESNTTQVEMPNCVAA